MCWRRPWWFRGALSSNIPLTLYESALLTPPTHLLSGSLLSHELDTGSKTLELRTHRGEMMMMMMKSSGGDVRQWVWRSINSLWKRNGAKLAPHTYTSDMGKRVKGKRESEGDKWGKWQTEWLIICRCDGFWRKGGRLGFEFGLMVLSQQMICVLAQCHVMRE